MRGKRSKWLMLYAKRLLTVEGVKLGEGYNHYNQARNCPNWEPAYVDGHRHDFEDDDNNIAHERMKDPEGTLLYGQFPNPGTVQCAWKLRIMYQNLKRLWKETKGGHEIFKIFDKRLVPTKF